MKGLKLLILATGVLASVSSQDGPRRLLIVGGYRDGLSLVDVELVTLYGENQGSQVLGDFPMRIEGAWGAQTSNDTFIICGGNINEDNDNLDTCFDFSLALNTWTPSQLSYISGPRAFAFNIDLEPYLWWISGGATYGIDDYLATSEVYDNLQQSFRTGPMLPEPAKDHCITKYNSTHMVLVGGATTSDKNSPKSYFFSLTDSTWTPMGDLMTGRMGHACGSFVDVNGNVAVYAAGGYISGSLITATASVEIYDERTNTWSEVPESFLPEPVAFGITSASGLLVGGGNGVIQLDTIYKFNEENLNWDLMDVHLNQRRDGLLVIELDD